MDRQTDEHPGGDSQDAAPLTGRSRLTFSATHPDDPHRLGRSHWLRASVLGATDGIVSISALLIGVAAAAPDPGVVLLTGAAGLVAGAMSIAASEYISVSSQSDIERAEVTRERRALRDDPQGEMAELSAIYRARGLSRETADRVAEELSAHDALKSHLRDEVGLVRLHAANPRRAALASGTAFGAAAMLPLSAAVLAPAGTILPTILAATLVALTALGVLGARTGGARTGPAVRRTLVWGSVAMAATYLAGSGIGAFLGA
jgi:VIT1/CCC1 family predicted Fe2+/Mn2+ transporter